MIIQSILESTIKGTGNGQTSIFPCQIFQLKEGVNTKEGDPNYDLFKLAIKCTAKRMYPNYANCDWSGNDDTKSYEVKQAYIDGLSEDEKEKLFNGLSTNKNLQSLFGLNIEDQTIVPRTDDIKALFSTMGCRTANGFDINWESQWKSALDDYIKNDVVPNDMLCTGQLKDGRGNIAPATIILPTLAMEAKKKASKNNEDAYVVDYFMDILEKAIEDCKDHLIERFNWICAQDPKSASFMYINRTFTSYDKDYEKEGIRGALKHGTLAIGQLGLYETLQILIGCGHDTQKGMELAKKIEQLFKTRCAEYKEQYKLNFGTYFTPAESLVMTAFNKFTKKYGLIENVNAYKDESGNLVPRNYFTNSMHVPVWLEMSPFDKIDIESQLTGYSSAGCITYVEIGDNAINNLDALEQIVLYAKNKDVPYFALNVRLSDCTKCGYSGYIDYDSNCPVCNADRDLYINDYARITGYLSQKIKHFNFGKQCETKDRKVHVDSLDNWRQKD